MMRGDAALSEPGESSKTTAPLLARLTDAASGEWLDFGAPRQVIEAHSLAEVIPALQQVQAQVARQGGWAAGLLSYEAAPAFDPALVVRSQPAQEAFPLLWFGLFDAPARRAERAAPEPAGPPPEPLRWQVSQHYSRYQAAIERIKTHIARGDTYQVNYTLRLRAAFAGQPFELFERLAGAQQARYAAYLDLGRYVVCSASPELFFEAQPLGGGRLQVSARPMKGTAARQARPEQDQAMAAWLQNDPKNRAENVMIVDMLRNDLGRIAEVGSVNVPRLFELERYPTVWQMTSTVTATTRASFGELMAALFPCASITGAPKVRTMQIIAALEEAPRRIYTGAIGWLAPGGQAQFSVAIRTALVDRHAGQVEYGVGGGIVWDSTPQGEWAEALLKARLLGDAGLEQLAQQAGPPQTGTPQ
jgi:para-aminobenzoate synthetase/4-amino-4-deoxychorismate lyase